MNKICQPRPQGEKEEQGCHSWLVRSLHCARSQSPVSTHPYFNFSPFCVALLSVYLILKHWHGRIWPQLRGLPGVADRATHLEGSPHLSCKRDQIKVRDYMDRRVTPSKWVTMPTWGPPPPCKQALKVSPAPFLQFQKLNHLPFIIWVNLVPLESHFYNLKSCYYFWTWVLQCQM